MTKIAHKNVKDVADADRHAADQPHGVRVSETFGVGCVRSVSKKNEMNTGQNTSQAADGMCWVLSDPFEWSEIEMGLGATDSKEGQKRSFQIPWASNFLRALNLLRVEALRRGRPRPPKHDE